MSVFREVSFHFRGEEIRLVPSLALLRRVAGHGINNTILAHQCLTGGASLEDLAIAHAEFMAEAGFRITEKDEDGDPKKRRLTEDESYLFVMDPGNLVEVQEFQLAYCLAVNPGVDLGKKLGGRATGAKAKKSKARKKTST